MHHRGTTDTGKSPRRGRCVWGTPKKPFQRVRYQYKQAEEQQLTYVCVEELCFLISVTCNAYTVHCIYKAQVRHIGIVIPHNLLGHLTSDNVIVVTATSPPNYRKRPNNEKATDDYHYEKFKKMNRRY